MVAKNAHSGFSFEDFLKEEGIYEEVTERALLRLQVLGVPQGVRPRDEHRGPPGDLPVPDLPLDVSSDTPEGDELRAEGGRVGR